MALNMTALLLRQLTLLLLTLHTGMAANYVQPNASKELFQLEKIPLEVRSMKELSAQLVVLSRRQHDESAQELRASAQMLALAMQLDPTSQAARDANQKLLKGNAPSVANQDQLLKAKSKLRFYKRWLTNSEAGSHANNLANCLNDATQVLQPGDHNKHAETGNWNQAIPAISAYQNHKPKTETETGTGTGPAPPFDTDHSEMVEKPQPNAQPSDTDTESSNKNYQLNELSTHSPLITYIREKYKDPKNNFQEKTRTLTKRNNATITTKIKVNRNKEALSIHFNPRLETDPVNRQTSAIEKNIQLTLTELINKRYPTAPTAKIEIRTSPGSYALRNDESLAATVALMLEASIQNQPLRKDVSICANINSEGKLSQPANLWAAVKILRNEEGAGRLIVPLGCKNLLLQILVYEEADFFTRWEILEAGTLDEALLLAAQNQSSELVQAGQLFLSVQNLALKSDITKLVGNKAVKKRLAEVLEASPNHVSAQILIVQGNGKRPNRLSEIALAHELTPIIRKMHKTLTSEIKSDTPSSENLKNLHEKLRSHLDPLERKVDRSNGKLYTEALDIANDFRRLGLIGKRISSTSDQTKKAQEQKKAKSLLLSMQTDCTALLEKNQAALGLTK